jgi:hypothetical protein
MRAATEELRMEQPMNPPRIHLTDLAELHGVAAVVTMPASLNVATPVLTRHEKALLAELRELWAGFDYFAKTGSLRFGEQPDILQQFNRYPSVRRYLALLGNTKRNVQEEKLFQKYRRSFEALRRAFSTPH